MDFEAEILASKLGFEGRGGYEEGEEEQGRIHGQYQSRTGGQGRKCVFSHFST